MGTIILAFVAGALLGVLVAYLIANRRYTRLHVQAEVTANALKMQKEQNAAEAQLRQE